MLHWSRKKQHKSFLLPSSFFDKKLGDPRFDWSPWVSKWLSCPSNFMKRKICWKLIKFWKEFFQQIFCSKKMKTSFEAICQNFFTQNSLSLRSSSFRGITVSCGWAHLSFKKSKFFVFMSFQKPRNSLPRKIDEQSIKIFRNLQKIELTSWR